jgi:hypothetical protein
LVVLVTGSRDYSDENYIAEALGRIGANSHYLIHGYAKGADKIAEKIARRLGWGVRAYPANWKVHGKAAGPIRNAYMIEQEDIDLVLAFPMPGSKGTIDCINKAYEKGLPIEIYL